MRGEADSHLVKELYTNLRRTRVVRRYVDDEALMCGIAGFSLGHGSSVGGTLVARALLAGIAERGADAVGYAHSGAGAHIRVTKLRGGASALFEDLALPDSASSVLIHVRDFTKGHPEIQANNHPIRHAGVVGIHNGVIENDDDLLRRHGISRAEPAMTVDSEAIFALMHLRGNDPRSLSELRGAMAAAWLDEREEHALFLARGRFRPLWIGRSASDLFFASTRRALAMVEGIAGLRLEVREVREGRVLRVEAGQVVSEQRFRPGRGYRERGYLPPVRAPREAVSCLERLAALAPSAPA